MQLVSIMSIFTWPKSFQMYDSSPRKPLIHSEVHADFMIPLNDASFFICVTLSFCLYALESVLARTQGL